MKRVTLGAGGIDVSRLAIGTGTSGWAHASDQTRKGRGWLARMFIEAFEHGVTFWDLADQYGSHPNAREALKEVDRKSVQILTKTTARQYDACKHDIERFLDELSTGYLDIVLLHAVTSSNWTKDRNGAMRALAEAKAAGSIGAVGVSCHSLPALERAADESWVDVILSRINYRGDSMDAGPDEVVPVLRHAHERGKGIIGMKVYGCGKLTGDIHKAIKFVFDLGFIDAITIGPTEDQHLSENIRLVESLDEAG